MTRKTIYSPIVLALLVALQLCGCNPRSRSAAANNDTAATRTEGFAEQHATGQRGEKSSADDKKGSDKTVYNAVKEAGDDMLMQRFTKDRPSMLLERIGYLTSYNKETLMPNWVAWHLTASRLKGRANRKGVEFSADEQVPEPRVDDWDYYNSGFDRGHICPAADNKMSAEAMRQSFLFTNVCPQNSNLNRGDWNELENACREWARKYGDIYIVSGPILYNRKHKKIGKHRVTVPEAFFKVVLRLGDDPKAIGFIYKNESGDRPKGDYVNTVDQVERITGIDFFPSLDDKTEAKVEAEANIDDWQ